MLHVIGLFFILGIGCDDLFVMCDAWVQAQWLAPPAVHQSTEARLWWSYKRAGKAMLVTTLTDVRTSHGSREQGAGSRRGGEGRSLDGCLRDPRPPSMRCGWLRVSDGGRSLEVPCPAVHAHVHVHCMYLYWSLKMPCPAASSQVES